MAKTETSKKKKVLIGFFWTLCAVAFLLGINFFIMNYTMGKQSIAVTTASQYYAGDKLQAVVDVYDAKSNLSTKAKIKAEIIDGKGKTVKSSKVTLNKLEGESVNIELPLPDELVGSYSLRVKASNGLLMDKKEIAIKINSRDNQNIIVNFDKGIYKPNDTINYRALIINDKTNKPIEDEVTVNIYDANNNRVYMNNGKTSDFGIVSGSFTLGKDLNSGDYKLEVITTGETTSKVFKVNPYITPQYEVSITSDKDSYVIDDVAHFTVNAKYFFGEPVVDASIVVKINNDSTYVTGLTDANGNYEFTYDVKNSSSINVNVEAEDSSHYFVQGSKTVYASEDVFNIEILPEYGEIIKGVQNRLYVLTTKPDGTPIKTRSTIRINNIERQLLTDEDGIGILDLTSEEVNSLSIKNNYDYYKNNNKKLSIDYYDDYYSGYSSTNYYYGKSVVFNVLSQDYDGHSVKKDVLVSVDTENKYAVKTDKLKYNQGDNIEVTIDSTVDSVDRIVMVSKGNKVIKLYTTDSTNINLDIGDLTGLVDISVGKINSSTSRYYWYSSGGYVSNLSKRTVFVKPNNDLVVDVSTDKEEYAPGNTMNLNITTKVDGQNEDSAVLVSILDNAILSLADNDLSIDNVKLALEDIELSDGVTAADLYAMIVEDKSPAKLGALLLKQKASDIYFNVNRSNYYSYRDYEPLALGILFIYVGLFLLSTGLLVKIEKNSIRDAIKKAYASMAVMTIVLELGITLSRLELLGVVISLVVAGVIGFLVYKVIKNRWYDSFFDISFYCFVGTIFASIYASNSYRVDNEFSYWATPIVIALIVFAFCFSLVKRGKVTNKKGIKNGLVTFFGNLSAAIASITLVAAVMDSNGDLFFILFLGWAIAFWAKRKYFNSKLVDFKVEKKKSTRKDGKIQINIDGSLGGLIAVIIVVAVGGVGCLIRLSIGTNGVLTRATYAEDAISETTGPLNQFSGATDSANSSSTGLDFSSAIPKSAGVQSESSSSGSILDGLFGSKSNTIEEGAEVVRQNTDTETTSSTSEKTSKVRNVFLESLAFLPDLVAKNGQLQQEVQISDNITTWNVQVVANTKSGNLGFASKEFRVFKPFFANFELPKNSVVGDTYYLPVTVYSYNDYAITANIKIEQNDWSTIGQTEFSGIASASSPAVFNVPITVNKAGNNTLRITATATVDGATVEDIIEKSFTVSPNGLNKTNVVGSGIITEDYNTDYFAKEDAVEGTRDLIVKVYPNLASQQLENIESILRMPTGCFEQTSSSLYPDALVLKYLNNSKVANTEAKEKALEYISSGYQRLLTFEVPGTNGGFSLYGRPKAEIALTAYGLMELTDVNKVYKVDENVLTRMKDYVYNKGQSANGGMKVDENSYLGSHLGSTELAVEAYTIWALSEADSSDSRLQKSIEYLENKLDKADDTYTLALIANALVNGKSSKAKQALSLLSSKIEQGANGTAYVTSKIRDYYGCYGRWQNVQATALTSLAFTRSNTNAKTNMALINYLVSCKDSFGTWGNTQATVLSLKALDAYGENDGTKSQTVKVTYGSTTKEIKIDADQLVNYDVVFENAPSEGRVSIDMEKGRLYYEIIEDYYVEYDKAELNKGFEVKTRFSNDGSYRINDVVTQTIEVGNTGKEDVVNGLIKINIPQGMTVLEESLSKLVASGKIEKYDYNYNTLNLYLRNTSASSINTFEVQYRTINAGIYNGGAVRVYDYYNPDYEGVARPQLLNTSF